MNSPNRDICLVINRMVNSEILINSLFLRIQKNLNTRNEEQHYKTSSDRIKPKVLFYILIAFLNKYTGNSISAINI